MQIPEVGQGWEREFWPSQSEETLLGTSDSERLGPRNKSHALTLKTKSKKTHTKKE